MSIWEHIFQLHAILYNYNYTKILIITLHYNIL